MATSVTYYTAPLHDTGAAVAASSTATGTTMNYLLDSNLDTYWSPTGTGTATIDIDTYPQNSGDYLAGGGLTSGSVDTVGLFLSNYNTDFSATTVEISTSSDNSTWTVESNSTWDHLTGPLFFFDLSATQSTRYYRFTFTSLPAIPKLSQVFLLSKNTLNRPNGYPVSDVPEYFSKVAKAGTGRRQITRTGRNPVTRYSREYLLLFPADHTLIETIYNECKGVANPFIFQEGTAVTSAVVCTMDRDIPRWSDVEDSIRTASYTFTSVPYIIAGESS